MAGKLGDLAAKLTGMKDKFGQVAAIVNPGC